MSEPGKKDDALAAAVRAAFQKHMENARLAAVGGDRPATPSVTPAAVTGAEAPKPSAAAVSVASPAAARAAVRKDAGAAQPAVETARLDPRATKRDAAKPAANAASASPMAAKTAAKSPARPNGATAVED